MSYPTAPGSYPTHIEHTSKQTPDAMPPSAGFLSTLMARTTPYRVRAGKKMSGELMTQARCLWTWGNADHGKCGLGTYPDAPIFAHQQFEPAKVKEPELPGKLIQQVVCGGAHTLLVTASGRLLACGLGEQGQLGLGSLESHGVFQEVTGIESVSGAAAGHWHSLAVSKKGNVYSWGSNKQHQLGIPAGALEQGPTSKGTARPATVAALRGAGVKQVACGSLHSMALTRDGEVYTWGFGKNGRLGHGDEEDQVLPKRLDSLRGEKIKAICAGYDVSAAISMAGKVWVWGYGFAWQLGQDDNKDRLAPTPLDMTYTIRDIAFGAQHAAAVGHTGVLLTWGNSECGVLGQGDTVKSVVRKPETLLEPAQLQNAKMVACGASHTLVLTGVGDVFAFGHGEHGKLAQGQGNEFDQFQPKQVKALIGKGIAQVACGISHSAAF